jgi:dTDP-4-dehydrorhamnose 3,5-epimerase
MIFEETKLPGAFVLDLERRDDDRGFFARTWCANELAEHGLNTRLVQANMSWNPRKGTVRGMHFQRAPHAETKLVRATRGAIYDVIIDLRDESPTFAEWVGVELSAENGRALYVPEGFAHGFQTLVPDCEVHYLVTEFYSPSAEGGVRWNDPAFGIDWPDPENAFLSDKDAGWPDFDSTA